VRRQRTLQATLEWSYQLLSEEERTFLRWLALFAGGWSLEAAEALGAETLGPADDVLELLSRLVAKSMVVVEEARNNELGVSRYRFLETIRQFAQRKLDESDEAEIARSRHCEYFLAWAERAAPNEVGPDQQIWLRRLDAKLDNHRAALEWSRGDGSDRELRLAAALAHFWVLRGHAAERRSRLRGALERGDPAPSRARAVALDWLGYLDLFEGDQCRPRRTARSRSRLARGVGGAQVLARALRHIATASGDAGPEVRALWEQALAAARPATVAKRGTASASWAGSNFIKATSGVGCAWCLRRATYSARWATATL
jgi:hypothetical protein